MVAREPGGPGLFKTPSFATIGNRLAEKRRQGHQCLMQNVENEKEKEITPWSANKKKPKLNSCFITKKTLTGLCAVFLSGFQIWTRN